MTSASFLDTAMGRVIDTRLDPAAQRELAAQHELGAARALREAARRNPHREAPILWLEQPFETPTGARPHLSLTELVTWADRLARG